MENQSLSRRKDPRAHVSLVSARDEALLPVPGARGRSAALLRQAAQAAALKTAGLQEGELLAAVADFIFRGAVRAGVLCVCAVCCVWQRGWGGSGAAGGGAAGRCNRLHIPRRGALQGIPCILGSSARFV